MDVFGHQGSFALKGSSTTIFCPSLKKPITGKTKRTVVQSTGEQI